jgi:miniconductance mechanosensitive channel
MIAQQVELPERVLKWLSNPSELLEMLLETLLETGPWILGILLVAWLSHIITRRLLIRWIHHLTSKTRSFWDDTLQQHHVFRRLARAVPATVVYGTYGFIPGLSPAMLALLENITGAIIVVVLIFALGAVISAVNAIYEQYPISKTRPIKGYLQVSKIVLYLVGAVVALAITFDESPLLYLSGIGAMTAVLMLVFKDTVLSLLASIQITQTDLIRVGDWIEMPHLSADGDVVDISLYTVRVQNWDKTVTGIPTHKFLTDAFKNWRNMPESGGRRIKRSIFIDKSTIRFLTEEEIEQFRKFKLLEEYIARKEGELTAYNENLRVTAEHVNMRRMTNIGTFRAYVINYLKNHPKINDSMTLLVRQLQPTSEGLPLELYVFSRDTGWIAYEGIQGDVFDHIMAIVPEFGLKLFQKPSGEDFSRMAG